MTRAVSALVTPTVLSWGRELARLKRPEAAKKASVTPEKLASWESGEAQPTPRQARLLAHAYHLPFAAFFLPEPPDGIRRIPRDLRRLAGETADGLSSDIQLDVRHAWERREIALELLAASAENPADFSFTADLAEDPEACGARLRLSLGTTLETQSSWRDPRVGFNAWRESAELLGVLVLQTSKIPLAALRAYSLTADDLPVVVVNRKDAFAARTFSLLHEIVHLGLHSDGLCDLRTDSLRPAEDQRLEVFCNAVAAAALIPREALLSQTVVRVHTGVAWDDRTIETLARGYSCSREAMLRRLLSFGLTDDAFYRLKRQQYREEYAAQPPSAGFVTPAGDSVSLLGKPYVRLVLNGIESGAVTTSDAADYLGVRLKHLPAIASAIGAAES